MTNTIDPTTESSGPPGHTQAYWRKHWDVVAVLLEQSPDELSVRREELAAAAAVLLTHVRSSRETQQLVIDDFSREWRCNKLWVILTFALRAEFPGPPSKLQIMQLLGFVVKPTPYRRTF